MNVTLLRQAIEPEQCSRREAERRAVMLAIKGEFGSEAILTHAPDGHPLLHVDGREMAVSVSHCEDEAVVAVAPCGSAIGIDIETAREQLRLVAPRFLTEMESEMFVTLPRLLQAWTAKEAVYKAALTPGLALQEIDITRIDSGMAMARGRSYAVSFPQLTPSKVVALAVGRD